MTSRMTVTACALVVLLSLPSLALAQRGGGNRPAPAPRPAAPAPRPAAPAPRAAAPAPVAGGFNFHRDTAPPAAAPPAAAMRRVMPTQRATVPAAGHRFTGPVIRNARAGGGNYGWNHGIAWQAAPTYWGGGFWGPFAIVSLGGLAAYGAYVDAQDQLDYPSYQVEPDTPGADLLADYALQQTPCGPPGLVVIWGPDNSVICAFPNDQIGSGNYQVDPATLTLISASS